MRPLTDDDFPMMAHGQNVYRRTESSPICTCADQSMAVEIAKRLNQANPVLWRKRHKLIGGPDLPNAGGVP